MKLPLALVLAIACGGCSLASPTFTKDRQRAVPSPKPTDEQPPPTADQQGLANVALQYQSYLPVGMVVLLVLLSFHDKMLMGWQTWLSHRREVLRIKKNGLKA